MRKFLGYAVLCILCGGAAFVTMLESSKKKASGVIEPWDVVVNNELNIVCYHENHSSWDGAMTCWEKENAPEGIKKFLQKHP